MTLIQGNNEEKGRRRKEERPVPACTTTTTYSMPLRHRPSGLAAVEDEDAGAETTPSQGNDEYEQSTILLH